MFPLCRKMNSSSWRRCGKWNYTRVLIVRGRMSTSLMWLWTLVSFPLCSVYFAAILHLSQSSSLSQDMKNISRLKQLGNFIKTILEGERRSVASWLVAVLASGSYKQKFSSVIALPNNVSLENKQKSSSGQVVVLYNYFYFLLLPSNNFFSSCFMSDFVLLRWCWRWERPFLLRLLSCYR